MQFTGMRNERKNIIIIIFIISSDSINVSAL